MTPGSSGIFMKHSLRATSIIEAMVVLLVVTIGIVGVFGLMNSSQKLANSTGQRIEAIQIARDGIESMMNIRDTNWILYAADYQNCWNVLNYNNNCIWDPGFTTDITLWINEWFTIYSNSYNQFELQKYSNVWWFSDATYRNNFRVRKDPKGFYTQSGWTDFNPIYTREIQVNYLKADNTPWDSNDPKMQVKAIIRWNDPASKNPRKLEMETLLTNWKQ